MMVNSDKSGVMFSRDPVENPENIVIEAVLGLEKELFLERFSQTIISYPEN